MADEKAEMLKGKSKVLLFRRHKDRADEDAKYLVFQTEHTFEYERDTDNIQTKNGTIVQLGDLEAEVTGIEAVQSKDDPVADMLQKSIIDGERLELWEVTIDEDMKNDDDEFPAVYAQGYLSSWEEENPTEDEPTFEGDFAIDMKPQFGETELTDDQLEQIEEASQYDFTDVKEDDSE